MTEPAAPTQDLQEARPGQALCTAGPQRMGNFRAAELTFTSGAGEVLHADAEGGRWQGSGVWNDGAWCALPAAGRLARAGVQSAPEPGSDDPTPVMDLVITEDLRDTVALVSIIGKITEASLFRVAQLVKGHGARALVLVQSAPGVPGYMHPWRDDEGDADKGYGAIPCVRISSASAERLLQGEWQVTIAAPTPRDNDDKMVARLSWKAPGSGCLDPAHTYYALKERVRIHSLKAKPHFNGLLGSVISRLRTETNTWEDARLGVQLDKGGHQLQLKPLNLERVCQQCSAGADWWLICAECTNPHTALFCSTECAQAGILKHKCKEIPDRHTPIPVGQKVSISRDGELLLICGLMHDLGKGSFVYAIKDDAGNDGRVELRADGKTLLLASDAMAQRMAGKQAVEQVMSGSGSTAADVGNGLLMRTDALCSGGAAAIDKAMGATGVKELEAVLEDVKKKKESRDKVQSMMRDEGLVALDIGGGLCVLGKPQVVDGVIGAAERCLKPEEECGEGSMCDKSHEHKPYYTAKSEAWKKSHARRCEQAGFKDGRGQLIKGKSMAAGPGGVFVDVGDVTDDVGGVEGEGGVEVADEGPQPNSDTMDAS